MTRQELQSHENHIKKIRKAMTRYLLVRRIVTIHPLFSFGVLIIKLQDNSQMCEQWLALKLEADRKVQSSLALKSWTVSSLHVVCYLVILAVYFKFQWVFFSSPDPCSCRCSSPDQLCWC
jgi:hypothetical protein